MPQCPRPDKISYLTHEHAAAECRKVKAKRVGKGAKLLTPYLCQCGFFHLGRSRPAGWKTKPQPAPAPTKQPTPHELKRKAKREAEAAERAALFADWADTLRCVARMVDLEIARMERQRANSTRP